MRLFIDLEQEADIVTVFRYQGGRKFIVASQQGRGFVVAEDECLANTRKGKQVLNVKAPDEARAIALVEGELVAAIGENRKMVIFPLEQVPEMTRGARRAAAALQGRRPLRRQDLQGGEGPDLDRRRRPRLHAVAEGTCRLARQPRRCRPAAPKGFPKTNKFGNGSAGNGKNGDKNGEGRGE